MAAVVYGLYGSATLLWGMSSTARVSKQFPHFWASLVFIINGNCWKLRGMLILTK